jgi:iron complex transport system substrate-binding protein
MIRGACVAAAASKPCRRPGGWLLSLALLGAVLPAAGVEVSDDSGAQVRLAQPAQRIISLAPHVTEMLFAAGAGAKLVGTVDYSDYPPAAARLPRVGGYHNLDLERILALRPDLVVAWESGNPPLTLQRLRSFGLRLFLSEPRLPEDIARDIEALGQLAGTTATAQPAAVAFRRRLAQLRARYHRRAVVSVFYQIWDQPLMTVNGAHLISQVIRLCGGRNVFAALAPLAPVVDVEAVIRADPDVIVLSAPGEDSAGGPAAWRRYPSLTAVRNGNLFFIPPDLLQRSGPRVLDGAEILCRDLDRAR